MFPTSILQRKIRVCIYRRIACTSRDPFQNNFCIWSLTVSFQVLLEAGGYFLWFFTLFQNFNRYFYKPDRVRKQWKLVPTSKFWIWLFNLRFKKLLLGFAQTRCSAQNCAGYASLWMLNKLIFSIFPIWRYIEKPEPAVPVLPHNSGEIHKKPELLVPKNVCWIMICFLQTTVEPWKLHDRLHGIYMAIPLREGLITPLGRGRKSMQRERHNTTILPF